MSEKEKNHVVYVDEATHTKLAIMAAIKKVSIKKCLKELVEREKKGLPMLQKKEMCGFFDCDKKSGYLDNRGKIAICADCYDSIKNQSEKDRFLKMI